MDNKDKLPDYFPYAAVECKEGKNVAGVFFECFSKQAEKVSQGDLTANPLKDCAKERSAYEQCMNTFYKKAPSPSRYRVQEEYRVLNKPH